MARFGKGRGSGRGLLRTAERAGLVKGVGGSRNWFYVGTGLWTLRTVRRLAERKTEVLLSEPLEPGQRIVIANARATHDDAERLGALIEAPQAKETSTRKERKAQAKQAERAAEKAARPKRRKRARPAA